MDALFGLHSSGSSGSAANSPVVRKLLAWRIADDDEKFAEKAIGSLVKKLRKRRAGEGGEGGIEDLEWALSHPHSSHSNCVTISRSQDGRLQVSHRKGLPHVIYCRVFRWKDVSSPHQLRSLPVCRYPFDSRTSQLICCNPFHYSRVDKQATAPVSSSISPDWSTTTTGGAMGGGGHQLQPVNASSPLSLQSNSSVAGYTTPDSDIMMASSMASSASYFSTVESPGCLLVRPNTARSNEDAADATMKVSISSSNTLDSTCWANIAYYELNSRVGELFKIWSSPVIMDGFTAPSQSASRICLGSITNVNRNPTIENARKHIGRGVRFTYENGNLDLENMSDTPVFVQSRNCNVRMQQPLTTVYRIPPSARVNIFDIQVFQQILAQAQAEGFGPLYELQKMAFIRISFVKGWGAEYTRQEITATPCWIEIQLHQPLKWIDSFLPTVLPSDSAITSYT